MDINLINYYNPINDSMIEILHPPLLSEIQRIFLMKFSYLMILLIKNKNDVHLQCELAIQS
jgi:hypothetical protein